MTRRVDYLSLLLILSLFLCLAMFNTGCGGSSPPDCSTAVSLGVAPSPATADHLAASPGNQVLFVASDTFPQGCIPRPVPIRTDLHWSVSDTTNVTIGNTLNVNYGLATCINATPVPATVTATGTNSRGDTISGTSQLTCK